MVVLGEPERRPGWLKLCTALYYCLASMTVQFMNKALFTLFRFNFPLAVAFLQMAIIAPVCYAVARPKLELATTWHILPLALVNVLNVVSGLIGTGGLNVPMFIALRRFTLLCTIVLERALLGKRHDRATLGAVAVMVGGAGLAAVTDLTFSAPGYAAVLANDFLTALYLILIKNTPGTASLTTTGLLFYNAALSLPLLAVALAISPELPGIWAYPDKHSTGFQVTLGFACALGLTINHSTFVCTKYNDPLTTSVAGSLKNILMSLIGAFSFGDFFFAPWNVAGLATSMAGAIWYATRAALKARRKGLTQQLLLRDPSRAGPTIGRDRLGALRANERARNGGAAAPAGVALTSPGPQSRLPAGSSSSGAPGPPHAAPEQEAATETTPLVDKV